MDPQWHVATIRSNWEFKAEEDIRQLGFDAYVPRCRRFRMIGRRKAIAEWPLIAGYVFVYFDKDNGAWKELHEVDGVEGILCSANVPCLAKLADIERLRRSENAGAFDFTIANTLFKIGDRYRIAEGPFADFIARFRSASSKRRAKIAIEFFSGLIEAEIDVCNLAQIS